ncbi:MAG TPA: ATP-binding protein [Planctomycetota bacterium]|nr:ATP-binding protein [Planctomycetota bacterium]
MPVPMFQFSEHLNECLLWVLRSGEILYANRSALRFLHRDLKNTVGTNVRKISRTPEEDVTEYLSRCMGSREPLPGGITFTLEDGTERVCRCDGSVVDLADNKRAVLLRIQERRSLRVLDALSGGGTMGALIRKHDWSKSALGRLETWPQSLLTAASICLSSKFPMIIWWGKHLSVLYNDAYIPIFAAKHPHVLGKTGFEAWGEVWDIIGPMLNGVLERAESTWSDDELLLLNRSGYLEETYFTWSYSPIRDEGGGVGGVFSAVFETTNRVLSQRRLRTLRELTVGYAKSLPDACTTAISVLERNRFATPFALLYLRESNDGPLKLRAHFGVAPESISLCERAVSSPTWPFPLSSTEPVVISEPQEIFGKLSGGAWPEPPKLAVGLQLTGAEQDRPAGQLILGVSPRRAWDDDYRGFQQLVARQISILISSAKAYEEEKKRAEALAEIDRLKTAFFSNVSHEFRTPLTLMIGPVEDALHSKEGALSGESLATVHRNGLRLLKLVNTILDFARIEAGRVDASYEPIDLAEFTSELASSFESAMERAGLKFVVDCEKSSEPAYVDREMWEKIVLNLLSNAFKFTLHGEVRLSLRTKDSSFELIVEDTGIGIPPEDMPHIFERFHRVKGAQGRTLEGTGIGLALVHELVRLHQGAIRCESVHGTGTRFLIHIPKGSAHLPADKIGAARSLSSTALGANPYLQEALRWLPSTSAPASASKTAVEAMPDDAPAAYPGIPRRFQKRPTVLVADDNADMREYLARLLSVEFDVQTVTNGQAALDAVRKEKPDLILSDVMMPVLDGFALLKALRDEDDTRTLPFILLSARAGEEAKIEGLQAGADDYLVKPFNARELVARVTSHLELAHVRKEAQERERELRELAEQALARERQAREEADKANRSKDEFLAIVSHELRTPLTPILGWTRMLQNRSLEPAVLEKGLSIIDRNIQSQVKLIEDLLDIGRIVSNKIRLEYKNVGLVQVIEAAIESLRHSADNRNIRIKFVMEESVGAIWGDPERLKQIFLNLLSNAVKFSKDGHVITIRLLKENGFARVDVSDTGIGIDASFLPRMFKRFSQFDSTTTRKYGGLGIGLSVVRQLVELHGGKVRVASEGLEKGSTFTVTLPVHSAARAPSTGHATAVMKPGHEALVGKSILVVDDEEDAREFLRFALERAGAKVVAANSVVDAVSEVSKRAFDVVITDIGMPGEDGFALLRQLRAAGIKTPAIAVTAFARSEDSWRALSEGFHRHIAKPIDPDELCAAVSASLQAS